MNKLLKEIYRGYHGTRQQNFVNIHLGVTPLYLICFVNSAWFLPAKAKSDRQRNNPGKIYKGSLQNTIVTLYWGLKIMDRELAPDFRSPLNCHPVSAFPSPRRPSARRPRWRRPAPPWPSGTAHFPGNSPQTACGETPTEIFPAKVQGHDVYAW